MHKFLTVALLLAPLSALAADPETPPGDEPTVVYKAVTEFDMDSVDVEASIQKPAGNLVVDRKRAQFPSMIKLRGEFNAEMRATVDEI